MEKNVQEPVTLVVKEYNNAQVDDVITLFKTDEGYVNKSDLSTILRCCGRFPSRKEVKKICETSQGENIEINKIHDEMKATTFVTEKCPNVESHIEFLNEDGDQMVSLSDLMVVLTGFGEKLPQKMVRNYFEQLRSLGSRVKIRDLAEYILPRTEI